MADPPERRDPVGPLTADPESLRRRRGVKWRRYPDALAAWVADMDLPPAPPILDAIRAVVDAGDLGYPDGDALGLPGLLVDRLDARFGWRPDTRLVLPLTDVMQGVLLALTTLTEPGDGVVVQTPIYPPFHKAVARTGRRFDDHPLRVGADGRAALDVDGLARVVDDRTRMLLVCHPHNPTGRAFDEDELRALAELAVERDLWVVSDEIHADLVLPGARHVPFASLGPEVAERTLTLTSPTKAFNLAGTRIAFGIAGSPALLERLRSVPGHLLGHPGTVGLVAAEAAWRHGGPWLDAVLALVDDHRRRTAAALADVPGVVHHPPEATYLAWLDLRALDLPGGPWRYLLDHAGVALSDGADFTRHGEGHVRLNLATSTDLLDEILGRIVSALR
ncbi:MAG TPA: aminotransferase class I/II-fold pyridoxal phosphate-dependent enzyme [Acidimicrobiales bacterium]|nr:aminotransferase class I/II-fold pyridoxal phosphate-dependent enzyme [Acidimicrobiales bacterium]